MIRSQVDSSKFISSDLTLTCVSTGVSSDHLWSDLTFPALYANKHVHPFHLQRMAAGQQCTKLCLVATHIKRNFECQTLHFLHSGEFSWAYLCLFCFNLWWKWISLLRFLVQPGLSSNWWDPEEKNNGALWRCLSSCSLTLPDRFSHNCTSLNRTGSSLEYLTHIQTHTHTHSRLSYVRTHFLFLSPTLRLALLASLFQINTHTHSHS